MKFSSELRGRGKGARGGLFPSCSADFLISGAIEVTLVSFRRAFIASGWDFISTTIYKSTT
jgi:hypothetical protein